MDIDQINERIERLRDLMSGLDELQDEANGLDVELDKMEIERELRIAEKKAEMLRDVDRETLCRAFERMAL